MKKPNIYNRELLHKDMVEKELANVGKEGGGFTEADWNLMLDYYADTHDVPPGWLPWQMKPEPQEVI